VPSVSFFGGRANCTSIHNFGFKEVSMLCPTCGLDSELAEKLQADLEDLKRRYHELAHEVLRPKEQQEEECQPG
jgi:hypothetical protein